MNKPKTHMTLDDRIAIQEGLDNNLSVRVIARSINKSHFTVKREVDARKCPKGRRSITVLPNCANRKDCDVHGLCKITPAILHAETAFPANRSVTDMFPEHAVGLKLPLMSAMDAPNRLLARMTGYFILKHLQMTCTRIL